MATSEKPVETEEPLDATDQEWEESEEDPTVSEEIVPYEGGIVPRAQWDLKAVFEAFGGVALWAGGDKPVPALFYQVPNRGEGLSVRAMRILSAMRGGFEEMDCKVREAQAFDPVIGPDGKVVVQTVPAVEALVPIRDLVAGNVRIGVWVEAMAKQYSDKSRGYYLVPNPHMVAIAKAKRQAYSEHFAAIIEPLLKAFKQECSQKRQFFSGEVPPYILQGLPDANEEGAPVPSAVDQKRLRAEVAIGNAGRDEITDRLRPLVATFGEDIREEFVTWGTETFGTSKIANWPARRKGEIDAWFREKAQALDQALDSQPVVGDSERPIDPFEDAVAPEPPPEAAPAQEEAPADHGLSGAITAAKGKGMTDEEILAARNTAGLLREVTPEGVKAFSKLVAGHKKKSNGKSS